MKKRVYDDVSFVRQELKRIGVLRLINGLPTDMLGNKLVDLSVPTMTDLLALNTTTYDKQKIIVENPANLISRYFPSEFFCSNGGFKMLGGLNMHTEYTPRFRVTWPGIAWNDGTFDLISAAGGAQTTISANPNTNLHGLTLANQITAAGNSSIYISGSTGAGSVDWPIGWMMLTDVPTTYGLTVLYPYNAALRTPIITDLNIETPLLRIPMPKFSNTYMGWFEYEFIFKNYVAAGVRTRIRYGDSGMATTAGTEIFNINDAGASLTSMKGRVTNTGTIGKNILSTTAINNVAATAVLAAGVPVATDIDNVTNSTDLLYTCIAPSGADVVHELIQYNVKWRY